MADAHVLAFTPERLVVGLGRRLADELAPEIAEHFLHRARVVVVVRRRRRAPGVVVCARQSNDFAFGGLSESLSTVES
jgi:hypothetical protein